MKNKIKKEEKKTAKPSNVKQKEENKTLKKKIDSNQPPQKKSVALLFFLSVITLGIYSAIWYLKRAPEFDKLETQNKLKKRLTITYLVFVSLFVLFQIVVNFLIEPISELNVFSITLFVITIIFLCLYFILAFNTRTILNESLAKKGVTRKVSWFFTLIFNFLYLQYEINRILDDKENEKRTGPWVCFVCFIIIPLVLALIGVLWYLFIR